MIAVAGDRVEPAKFPLVLAGLGDALVHSAGKRRTVPRRRLGQHPDGRDDAPGPPPGTPAVHGRTK